VSGFGDADEPRGLGGDAGQGVDERQEPTDTSTTPTKRT
jgi:hypothetical protein